MARAATKSNVQATTRKAKVTRTSRAGNSTKANVDKEVPIKKTRTSRVAKDKASSATPTRTRRARGRGEVELEVEGSRRKKAVTEAVTELFNPLANIDDQLDAIEKDYTLSGSSMNPNEVRQSTGLLVLDLILGKGLIPGWYTFFGPEQSCKSTGASTLLGAALTSEVPIISIFDFEGSVNQDYLSNIIRTQGFGMDIKHVFGLRDNNGAWLIKPRVRYYAEGVAEKFFDYLSSLERKLPDKVCINDQWYLVYENTKANQKMLSGHYDTKYLAKTGKLRVPAKDGTLQALIIVDSYPAMLPERLDVDDPGSGMAAQARMFSEQLRRVKGKMRAKRIAVVGVNQLRKAPGVMYGCYHGSVRVTMADGSKPTIQEVVENKLTGPVLAFDPSTSTFVPKPITGWFNNGPAKKWLKITYETCRNNGGANKASIVVTPEHLMWSEEFKTLRAASKFKEGDTFSAPSPYTLSYHAEQLYLGMMLGDGWFSVKGDFLKLNFTHKAEHQWLTAWKRSILNFGGCDPKLLTQEMPYVYNPKLAKLAREQKAGCEGREKRLSREFCEALDLPAVAVWYMDDGGKGGNILKMQSYPLQDVRLLCDVLNKKFKTNCTVATWTDNSCVSDVGHGIRFDTRMYNLMAPYVHSNFRQEVVDRVTINCNASGIVKPETIRKYIPKGIRHFGEFKAWGACGKIQSVPVKILKVEEISKGKYGRRAQIDKFITSDSRYEIEVKDLGLFVADGVVGKNSPEYEPGGEALKFFSDVRLRVFPRALSSVPGAKGKGQIEEEPSIAESGGKDTYRYIHVRAHKNKLSVPNLEGWLRLWITDGDGEARGFDPVWDTYQYLASTGQVSGKRSALKLNLNGKESPKKALSWLEFKALIIGTRSQKLEVFKKAWPGVKPFDLRAHCKRQLHEKNGLELYFNHSKVDAEEETEELD